MEILNEKAERMQAKKEVEIMREIEEKVKKEIKSINSPAPSFSNGQQSAASISQPSKYPYSPSNTNNNERISNNTNSPNRSENPNTN